MNEDADGKTRVAWLPLAGFVFGVAVLVFIFYFVGVNAILEPLGRIGWGFLIVVGLNGLRHYLRALNLCIAIPRGVRTFSVRTAFSARLAGETINTVAFTGPVLGDAAKTAMLNRKVSLEHSATAVLIDEIIYYVSSLLMILGGAMVVLYAYGTSVILQIILVGLLVFSAFFFFGLWWVIRKQLKPVSWLIDKIRHRRFVPKSLIRKREVIFDVETNLLQFYGERPRAFRWITAIILVTHLLSVLEAYWTMRLLGFDLSADTAFIIESLTKAVNFVFFLIPGTVGAYEGGNGVILSLLGYSAGAGVALALVRRGGILFWTLIGGGLLLWRGAKSGAQQLTEAEVEPE